jgi:magnesium chelatase subunit I
MENVVSNAERRALGCKDDSAVPRVTDIYSALPAITGKLELEYEGELKGGDTVARELIRTAVGKIYNEYFEGVDFSRVVKWFDLGGSLKLGEGVDSASMVRQLGAIQGLMEKTRALGLGENEPDSVRAAAAEFILEGLYAHRRIGRNEERGFSAEEKPARREPRERDRDREEKEGKGERPNFRRGYN